MTTPPLDLPAIQKRLASIPPKGESAMNGMAFPVTAVIELWTLRHIARVDAPVLLDRVEYLDRQLDAADRQIEARSGETAAERIWKARAEAAEKQVAKVREVHKPVPVYTTEAGDCEHDGDCEAVEISAGSYCPVHTDGLTCNECAELAEHADDLPAYPCPTITAIDTHTPETETTP